MMWVIETTSKMIDALAMVVIMCFVFGALLRNVSDDRWRGAALGVAFGFAGMMVMLSPVSFAPGMAVDPRALMVALPAAFGGLRAGTIAWAIVVATRFSMGWPDDNPGQVMSMALLGITSHLVGGLAWRWLVRPRVGWQPAWFVALSLVATVELAALLATNVPVVLSIPGLAEVIAVQHGVRSVGLWLGAFLMLREETLAARDHRNTLLARFDPLTAVHNRRGFDAAVAGEGLGEHYAVLCFDLDEFKQFNDLAGHGDGDRLLMALADILRRTMPRNTIIARFGGDEFVVVLRAPFADRAAQLGWQVVDRLRSATVLGDDEPAHTVSVGHAATEDGAGIAALLREADKALYRAKAQGGDALASHPRARGPAAVPALA